MAYRERRQWSNHYKKYFNGSSNQKKEEGMSKASSMDAKTFLDTRKNESQSTQWLKEENYKNTYKSQNRQFEFEIIPPSEESRANVGELIVENSMENFEQPKDFDIGIENLEESIDGVSNDFRKSFKDYFVKNEDLGRDGLKEAKEKMRGDGFFCETIETNDIKVYREGLDDRNDFEPLEENLSYLFDRNKSILGGNGGGNGGAKSSKGVQTESNYAKLVQRNTEYIIKIEDLERENFNLRDQIRSMKVKFDEALASMVIEKARKEEQVCVIKPENFRQIYLRIANSIIGSLFQKFHRIPYTLRIIVKQIFTEIEIFFNKKISSKVSVFCEIFGTNISNSLRSSLIDLISKEHNSVIILKSDEVKYLKSKLAKSLIKLLHVINCAKNDTFNPKKKFHFLDSDFEKNKATLESIFKSSRFEEMIQLVYGFHAFIRISPQNVKFGFSEKGQEPVHYNSQRMTLIEKSKRSLEDNYINILPAVYAGNGAFYLDLKPFYLALPRKSVKKFEILRSDSSNKIDGRVPLRKISNTNSPSFNNHKFDGGNTPAFNGSFGDNSEQEESIAMVSNGIKSSICKIRLKEGDTKAINKKTKIMIVRENPKSRSPNLRKEIQKQSLSSLRSQGLQANELSHKKSIPSLKISKSRSRSKKSFSRIPKSPISKKCNIGNNENLNKVNIQYASRKKKMLRMKRKKGDSYSKRMKEYRYTRDVRAPGYASPNRSPMRSKHSKSFNLKRDMRKESLQKLSRSYYDGVKDKELEFSKGKIKNELKNLSENLDDTFSKLRKISNLRNGEKNSQRVFLY